MNRRQLTRPGSPQELVIHSATHFLGLRYSQWDKHAYRFLPSWSGLVYTCSLDLTWLVPLQSDSE